MEIVLEFRRDLVTQETAVTWPHFVTLEKDFVHVGHSNVVCIARDLH